MTDQAKTTRQMTIDATLGNAERSSAFETQQVSSGTSSPHSFHNTPLSLTYEHETHISTTFPPFDPATFPAPTSRQITVSPITIHAHPQRHTSHGQQALILSTPDYAHATSTITTHKTRPQDETAATFTAARYAEVYASKVVAEEGCSSRSQHPSRAVKPNHDVE